MSNGNDTIKKILEVEDRFTESLNDFKREIKAIAKASDKADDDIEDLNDEIKKTGTNAKKAKPHVNKLGDAFSKAGGAVKGFVASYLSLKGLEMVKDLALASAEADSVSRSFERMAVSVGFTGDELTRSMREATDNMVSDVALQKNAMRSLISGIDPQDMLVSMKFVSRFAQSVGGDAEQLMQTVMTGLARGSAQFLDDVGIQVMGSSDVVGDAIEQMKEKMLELDETPFTNFRQFGTTIENMRIELGSYFTPILDDLVTLVGELMDTVSPEEANRIGESFGIMLIGITKGFAMFGLEIDRQMSNINNSINKTLLFGSSLAEGFIDLMAKADDTWLGRASAFITGNDLDETKTEIDALNAMLSGISTALADQLLEEEAGAEKRAEIWKEFILRTGLAAEATKKATLATNENSDAVEENAKKLGTTNSMALYYGQLMQEFAESRTASELEYLEALKLVDQEREQAYQDELARVDARREMVAQAITTAGDMASAVSSIHDSRMSELQREFDYEEERIQNSTMSRRKKEQALEKLADTRKKAEIESAKRQVVFATLTGASNTALAIQKQILAILAVTAETPGGPLVKIGAGVAMAGATAGYIASIKSAQASIPKREFGGVMRRNELYEVAERNKDEMITQGGKHFTMLSSGGVATPDVKGGGSTVVNMNITFGAGTDTQTIEERLPSMIAKGLEMADRQGDVRYERMSGFQRAIGN